MVYLAVLKILSLIRFCLFVFVISNAVGGWLKKKIYCCNLCQECSSCVFLWELIVSGFTFRSLIHFEFKSVAQRLYGLQVVCVCVWCVWCVCVWCVCVCGVCGVCVCVCGVCMCDSELCVWESVYMWILCVCGAERDCVCVCSQSCPTLWDTMDCSPPGSSVCEILQARILKWVTIPFSRGSTLSSALAGRFFTIAPPGKPQVYTLLNVYLLRWFKCILYWDDLHTVQFTF